MIQDELSSQLPSFRWVAVIMYAVRKLIATLNYCGSTVVQLIVHYTAPVLSVSLTFQRLLGILVAASVREERLLF